MSEMITIEQKNESSIEIVPYEHIIGISQPILGGAYDTVYCERDSIAELILTLIKLHPECRDEVSKGMEDFK